MKIREPPANNLINILTVYYLLHNINYYIIIDFKKKKKYVFK